MSDVSGFHYGFCIGKYSDVYSMPDDIATEFLRQFRVYLWLREATANKYKVLGWRHNDVGIGELDNEAGYPEFRDCNDSKGNEFIRSIIDQRQDLISQYDSSLRSASEEEERLAQRKKDIVRENYEWAMDRTHEREMQQEEKEQQRRKRIDAANAVVQVELFERKKAAKREAKQAAIFKEWEENKKQFAKKK